LAHYSKPVNPSVVVVQYFSFVLFVEKLLGKQHFVLRFPLQISRLINDQKLEGQNHPFDRQSNLFKKSMRAFVSWLGKTQPLVT